MTREQKEYLDSMESLFGHPGWRLITEDAKKQIYQLQADALDIKVCKNWDDVNVARGKAETLAELIMLPQIISNQTDAANASV